MKMHVPKTLFLGGVFLWVLCCCCCFLFFCRFVFVLFVFVCFRYCCFFLEVFVSKCLTDLRPISTAATSSTTSSRMPQSTNRNGISSTRI